MSDLVKVNPQEFGIEENRAKQISQQFKPMLAKMEELENDYNAIIKEAKDGINDEVSGKAKRLRLDYVKVRTATAKIHKEQKQFYLQAGRYIDGWKNAQVMASNGIEEKLKAIEEHQERMEAERREKLRQDRWEKLSKYRDHEPDFLASMDDDVFDALLAGAKSNYEAIKEAERKAEEERIAKEKAEAKERERQRQENIRLKKEAEERERQIAKEREAQAKAEAERKAKEEKRLKAERAKREKERKALEEKQRQEREAMQAKLEKERKERERLEAIERERQKEMEAQQEQKRQAELAPDKEKLQNLADAISAIVFPSVKDAKAEALVKQVKTMQGKMVNHILTNLQNL